MNGTVNPALAKATGKLTLSHYQPTHFNSKEKQMIAIEAKQELRSSGLVNN